MLICFLDNSKTFVCVSSGNFCQKFPSHFIQLIKRLYDNNAAGVKIPKGSHIGYNIRSYLTSMKNHWVGGKVGSPQ